ncbi:alanine--tRNA ligase [Candidatus Woesearchaeota archaeon]|nr:alanine--tRNA ligase [Candidatus Woesearchaeota archaeon]
MAVIPDKEVKRRFKEEVSKEPDRYFATGVLREEGFSRRRCKKCGTWFWSVQERETCDDPSCSGGFRFFTDNPSRKPLSYIEVWKEFSKLMRNRGYTPIDRYPVIARWRDDTDFVQASIYDFQPYVVSGEVDPPANPLVVPQFSLRFNDVDNVGVTMSHMTGFVMIGQHAFLPKEGWDQDELFSDIYAWLREGVGLPKEELVFHEDAWAGGGNYGPCMEFFSRGCELGNQVYMLYEQSEAGEKELPLKVLDMGMGQERVAWFTQGKGTVYDAAFPTVMEKLFERTKVAYDEELIQKYLPFASYLNADEAEDLDEEWERIGKAVGKDAEELKQAIKPLAALYSVAEHARTLLVALSDGGLPSNVGGGYNLRVILRRALGFIDEYQWDITLPELCRWHAEYLEPLFPELSERLGDVEKVLSYEREKHEEAKKRNKAIVERLVRQGGLTEEKLVELYDSQGISPEELVKAALSVGNAVEVPENFYALVAERHAKTVQRTATKKGVSLPLDGVPSTEPLYYDHYDYVDFEARVVKVIGRHVVLDRTAFYPTSGGQVHDIGTVNGVEVVDVFKQASPEGNHIIHALKEKPGFKEGDVVAGKIDYDRRLQLAQHHTATHLLTGAARRVLGDHVWQAGAAKTPEKSRLDLTHYEQLSQEEVAAIESLANRVVDENRPILKSFMARDTAEARYGFRLYQGGAVPGKRLRIVNIEGFDVEACGGTHLDVTGDVGHVKILKTSKVQDGVVRLEFVAGAAAQRAFDHKMTIIREAIALVGGSEEQLPGRVAELFEQWKRAKKGKLEKFGLTSTAESGGDVVAEMASLLKTQPEHVVKTIERFLDDIGRKRKG